VQVCPDAGDTCRLDFSVAITGTGGLSFSNIASVAVNVDDINDNAPNFPADQVVLDISEGAKVQNCLVFVKCLFVCLFVCLLLFFKH
jgi:hypothetical protein